MFKFLPVGPNTGRKTDTVKSESISGSFYRFYSIRFFQIRTGYARGGEPGQPGSIRGYGVSVEDKDGILVLDLQSRSQAEIESTYDVIVARAKGGK